MPDPADRILPDKLYTPNEVAQLDGCCVALVYRRLAAGEYAAFKDGRSTRIPGASILKRRATKLIPATFAPPRPQPDNFHTMQRAKAPRTSEDRPTV
jgi:hypothetical protein